MALGRVTCCKYFLTNNSLTRPAYLLISIFISNLRGGFGVPILPFILLQSCLEDSWVAPSGFKLCNNNCDVLWNLSAIHQINERCSKVVEQWQRGSKVKYEIIFTVQKMCACSLCVNITNKHGNHTIALWKLWWLFHLINKLYICVSEQIVQPRLLFFRGVILCCYLSDWHQGWWTFSHNFTSETRLLTFYGQTYYELGDVRCMKSMDSFIFKLQDVLNHNTQGRTSRNASLSWAIKLFL